MFTTYISNPYILFPDTEVKMVNHMLKIFFNLPFSLYKKIVAYNISQNSGIKEFKFI